MVRQALLFVTALGLILDAAPSTAVPIVEQGSGANPAAIQGAVDAFRADLGGANNGVGGSFSSGRREINWDGTPDNFSSPNNLPGNFFNANSPRGVLFSTPGTGFQVSAGTTNPTSTPVRFGNIDPGYPNLFQTFSAPKLFTPLGSTITDVDFFLPGTSTSATTKGFGAVFTNVSANASLQFFNGSTSLGTFTVPSAASGLSFLGVSFTSESVSRVRITSGTNALAAGQLSGVVVMDDFIYGEPKALVPEPSTGLLLAGGLATWVGARRLRQLWRGGSGTPRPYR